MREEIQMTEEDLSCLVERLSKNINKAEILDEQL